MKKFFKKIGKGFRELGRGLKKIFNSKIGRILGTLALAIALPVMFNALFTGGVTTGAGAEMTVEGVIQSTAQEGVKQTVKGVTAATAKGVKAGMEVKKAADVITIAERLQAVAIQTGELFKHPIQAVQRTFENLMGTNPTLLTENQATSYMDAVGKGKGDVFLSTSDAGAITDSASILDGVNEGESVMDVVDKFADQYEGLFPKETEVARLKLEGQGFADMPEKWGGLADKRMSYFDEYTPGTSFNSERNLRMLVDNSTPQVKADLFANKDFRTAWTTAGQNIAEKTGYRNLLPDPASFAGVKPYSSLGEAWTGETGIKRVGRTVDQIASSRVKDVLPFEYEGLGAQANIIKAGQGAVAASSLLMPQDIPEIEQPHYNTYAAQQATAALDQASQYGITPTQNDPIDMFNVMRNIDPNQEAMSIYQGILNKNQMSMGYGPYALTS